MDVDDCHSPIPAHVYVQFLQPLSASGQYGSGVINKYVGVGSQHGLFGNIFGALARTARTIIFPGLVRLGRNVINDVVSGNESFTSSATKRVRQQFGAGKGKKRKRPKKKTQTQVPRNKKLKKKGSKKSRKSKSVGEPKKAKHAKRKKRTGIKSNSISLKNLIEHSARKNPFL